MRSDWRWLAVFSLGGLTMLVPWTGCKKTPAPVSAADADADTARTQPSEPPSADDPAVADLTLAADKKLDPRRLPKAPAVQPLEVAVRFLLITHTGAKNAASERSDAEAQRRVLRLAQIARQQGTDFAELAKRYSEAPEKGRGELEVFREGDDVSPAFIEAALALGEGQVSDPVPTKFGYYLIAREPLEEYSTAHILIVYRGADRAPPALKRKKRDAQKIAEAVAKKAAKPGANFALLASRYSDSPSKYRGGVIGPIRPGSLIPGFETYLEAVRKLEVGGVSGVVETPYGFHVIRRLPLDKILIRHILISYDGARDATPREKRDKARAEALVTRVRAEALDEGADFAALAKQYSDGPEADKGGLLPPLARGVLSSPRVEQFAFALEPGAVSDLIESEFGYHLIKRLR